MTKRKKPTDRIPNQQEIDELVILHADEEAAWEAPVRVKRSKSASLTIPGELARRAAFLARLHSETALDKWVERILRERVELEELAFTEAKKSWRPSHDF